MPNVGFKHAASTILRLREINRGESNGNWKGGRIPVFCERCGTEFQVSPYRLKLGTAKYCSRSCRAKSRKGEAHSRWKGGRKVKSDGYVLVYCPGHPRASRIYVLEHILVAERALGKSLPPAAVIHHVNGDRADNRPANLVICQDQSYHRLIHIRQGVPFDAVTGRFKRRNQ